MNRKNARPLKILAVDDEADMEPPNDQRMRPRIRSGKYRFLLAGDSVKALESFSDIPSIGTIATDINTPNMDGLGLLARPSLIDPDIESVVISAYGDMRTAVNRGAFNFIVKPLDFVDSDIVIIGRTQAYMAWRRQALQSEKKMRKARAEEHVQAAGEPF